MRKWKKAQAVCLAAALLFGVTIGTDVEAARRDEIAQIRVHKNGKDFQYWQKDAASLAALKAYVKDVTNKKSANYIPAVDRIAVFDMDGTLIAERQPTYYEVMFYLDYMQKHGTAQGQADMNIAKRVHEAVMAKQVTKQEEDAFDESYPRVMSGITPEECQSRVKEFLQEPVPGMTNLKYGEAFFLPMVEVVSYLQTNDFKVYVVSGSDLDFIRANMDGALHVPSENMIGKEVNYYGAEQGVADSDYYTFARTGDKLLRGMDIVQNVRMRKVQHMARHIGRVPVLAFGNSSGDQAMYHYTLNNPKYKSMAFSLKCDDLERDYGDAATAEKMQGYCDTYGYVPVSMRNDWKTIFGYDVTKSRRTDDVILK